MSMEEHKGFSLRNMDLKQTEVSIRSHSVTENNPLSSSNFEIPGSSKSGLELNILENLRIRKLKLNITNTFPPVTLKF